MTVNLHSGYLILREAYLVNDESVLVLQNEIRTTLHERRIASPFQHAVLHIVN